MVQRLLRPANHRPLFRKRFPRRHRRQRPHHRLHSLVAIHSRVVWAYTSRFSGHHGRRSPPAFPRHSGNKWSPWLLGRPTLRRRRAQRNPLQNRRSKFRGQQSLRTLPRPAPQSPNRRNPRRLPKALHPTPRIHLTPLVPPPPLRPFLSPLHQHPRSPKRNQQTPPPRRSPPRPVAHRGRLLLALQPFLRAGPSPSPRRDCCQEEA